MGEELKPAGHYWVKLTPKSKWTVVEVSRDGTVQAPGAEYDIAQSEVHEWGEEVIHPGTTTYTTHVEMNVDVVDAEEAVEELRLRFRNGGRLVFTVREQISGVQHVYELLGGTLSKLY
jgi:hypothetical protein